VHDFELTIFVLCRVRNHIMSKMVDKTKLGMILKSKDVFTKDDIITIAMDFQCDIKSRSSKATAAGQIVNHIVDAKGEDVPVCKARLVAAMNQFEDHVSFMKFKRFLRDELILSEPEEDEDDTAGPAEVVDAMFSWVRAPEIIRSRQELKNLLTARKTGPDMLSRDDMYTIAMAFHCSVSKSCTKKTAATQIVAKICDDPECIKELTTALNSVDKKSLGNLMTFFNENNNVMTGELAESMSKTIVKMAREQASKLKCELSLGELMSTTLTKPHLVAFAKSIKCETKSGDRKSDLADKINDKAGCESCTMLDAVSKLTDSQKTKIANLLGMDSALLAKKDIDRLLVNELENLALPEEPGLLARLSSYFTS
jgi:hypothetical protein